MLNTRGVSSFNDLHTNNTRILARKACILLYFIHGPPVFSILDHGPERSLGRVEALEECSALGDRGDVGQDSGGAAHAGDPLVVIRVACGQYKRVREYLSRYGIR